MRIKLFGNTNKTVNTASGWKVMWPEGHHIQDNVRIFNTKSEAEDFRKALKDAMRFLGWDMYVHMEELK